MILGELRKGILINFVAKYSNIVVTLIVSSILARLLSPKEFGVVALILVFITFFNFLGDMGIGPAVIQNKDLNDRDITNIFNFTLIVGVILAFLFALFGKLIADFYDNNVYVNICKCLSLVVFFSIAIIVPQNLMYKEKKFITIGIINVSTALISGLVTVGFALLGFGFYSLVIQSITASFIRLILTLMNINIKIKLQWELNSIRKIWGFSLYQFSFNLVNYFSRNFDNLLIGRMMGPTALGYYDKAYSLMLYPLQSITFVIAPVLQPVLSEYQKDTDFILDTYKKIMKILSLVGVFFAAFCFFAAKAIILILFGDKWVQSIPTFQILSLSLIFQMVTSSAGSIFQATNKVKYLFISGILSTLVNITLMLIGSIYGKIEYVALGILIAFGINFFQVFYLLAHYVFKVSTFSLLIEMRHSIIIFIIMGIPLYYTKISFDIVYVDAMLKLILALFGFFIGLIVTGQFNIIKQLFVKRRTIERY